MSDSSESRPRLSVIVPTCNRPSSLARCLAGISGQSFPLADLELIIVDDSGNSEDSISLPENLDLPRCRMIKHSQNRGAAAARNTGAQAAKSTMLAFVDDDCRPEPDWVRALLAAAAAQQGVALAGAVLVAEPQPGTDRVTQLLSAPTSAADGGVARAPSANLAVPADGFAEVGGFDESYHHAGYEDYDFCLRWRQSGRSILAVPDAVIMHDRDTSLRRFWKQHYRNGRGAAHHYGRGPTSPRPPLKSAIGRMLRTVGAGRGPAEQIGHLGLVGLSQIAMVAGFAAGRLSTSQPHQPR